MLKKEDAIKVAKELAHMQKRDMAIREKGGNYRVNARKPLERYDIGGDKFICYVTPEGKVIDV